ncbi:MAG: M20/M25/M40 family metallo-hydrolase [Phycisphaerales bacterium]|nr:M20/M25/M40 family metallo-hydrolase [Phycisphaerales bacterium]
MDRCFKKLASPGLAGCAWIVAVASLHLGSTTGCAQTPTERFQSHVNYLASDELEGRGLGTPGIQQAANYIAARFKEAGLKPGVGGTSYLQTFEVPTRKEATDEGFLAIAPLPTAPVRGMDFVAMPYSSNDAFDGDVVFCGYGIDSDERKQTDFAHLDLKGKIALMFRGAPNAWEDDAETFRHSMARTKVYACKERGAAAVMFIAPNPKEGRPEGLPEFDGTIPDAYGLPALQVSRDLADRMLIAANMDRLDALQTRIDKGEVVSGALANVKVKGRAGVKQLKAEVHNVIGVLEADPASPLSKEYVILGAHYDHLGNVIPWQRTFKGGQLTETETAPQIHNGADDNASGTAGVIELARRFAAGPKPKRNVVFIAFTAEEAGLHGSQYFVDHPTLAGLDNPHSGARLAAMINMDMIGRLSTDGVLEVFGADSAEEFKAIIEKHKAGSGLNVKTVAATSNRSDDASFYRTGVPALHFYTGTHQDYHKPTDDADKINAEGAVKCLDLIYKVSGDLVAADVAPKYVAKLQSTSPTAGGTPVYRVVMGVSPSYAEESEPGMRVMDVSKEGPAEVAGMKPGDRIIRIGSAKVNTIYDYMGALGKNKPGEVVEVEVTRGGEKLVLKVTLAGSQPAKK